jgi:hypothetical protein
MIFDSKQNVIVEHQTGNLVDKESSGRFRSVLSAQIIGRTRLGGLHYRYDLPT